MADPDRLLQALDPEQRAVATALRGPVCVLAGAGTGKTRAITHRIAYGVATGSYQPASVLAVTFTQRAAGELRGRLAALGAVGVQARTFHSWALRQARYFWPQTYGAPLPPIVDRKFAVLGEAAGRHRIRLDSSTLRDLAGEIEWAKVCNTGPEAYEQRAQRAGREVAGLEPAMIARLFTSYEEVKADRGVIDLEDVLLCAVAVLDRDERVAAQVRGQYRTFVVDEYQDTSPLQQTLLELWLGGREEICVVGDPAQTIYSWAGADPRNLVDFRRRYPQAQLIELVRDYRSTAPIVAVANAVLAAAGPAALPGRVQLRSERQQPDPAELHRVHRPSFTEFPDEVAEAAAIAAEVEKLHADGIGLREIAVLFRINAQSEPLERAFAERGIATVVKGAERFFDRAEIKQAAIRLRALAGRAGGSGVIGADGADGGDDDGDGAAGPNGAEAISSPGAALAAVDEVLAAMNWTAEPPSAAGVTRERWESLSALRTLAEEFVAEHPGCGPVELSVELDRRAAIQHAPVADGVTLATLHATKGQEWMAVFIAGAHEGTLPITYATTPEQIEEERRLFYVGITRARDRLAISWSLARAPGGRGRRRPTRFLDPLQVRTSTAAGAGPGAGKRTRRKQLARCRVCGSGLTDAVARKLGRCADCPSGIDEALFERLRQWRAEQAGEQRLPAYCVFTDATLTAIAEARPNDVAQLLRLPGIGQAKVAKYGAAVLRICAGGDEPVEQRH